MSRRTFLALGDSYTIGEGVEPAGRWPAHVVARLRTRAVDIADARIVAQTGWTTDELDAGIDASGITGSFDLVSLLIGVNDAYRGRDAASYARVLPPLIERAVAFAGGRADRVVVVSIPDWSATPFADGRDRVAIASSIVGFNMVAREAALRAGASWADITPTSLQQAHDWLVADGLHPSAGQYAAWAGVITPIVHRMLVER